VLQSGAYVLEMDENKITSKGLRRKIDTVSDWHAGSVQQQQWIGCEINCEHLLHSIVPLWIDHAPYAGACDVLAIIGYLSPCRTPLHVALLHSIHHLRSHIACVKLCEMLTII
jgi:hypothetical protein